MGTNQHLRIWKLRKRLEMAAPKDKENLRKNNDS